MLTNIDETSPVTLHPNHRRPSRKLAFEMASILIQQVLQGEMEQTPPGIVDNYPCFFSLKYGVNTQIHLYGKSVTFSPSFCVCILQGIYKHQDEVVFQFLLPALQQNTTMTWLCFRAFAYVY